MSCIYIVATPIGNLEDISLRAIRILKEVDFILCEDTRRTKILLAKYDIKIPTISYHQHSKLEKIDHIKELLKRGKNLALVSDAGTPGISDPGNKLLEEILLNLSDSIKIIPIPGPSALLVAASISGFPMDKFLFMGFPPQKNKRRKFFEEIVLVKHPVVFYESTYRILKTLQELKDTYTRYNIQDTRLVVCRELTKKFEEAYRGSIDKIIENLKKGETRGEFVVIVSK